MTKEVSIDLTDVPDIDDDDSILEPPAVPREPSQVYSVRIPVEKLELLRKVAAEQHKAPSVLIRTWVLERLDLLAPDGVIITANQVVDDLTARVIYLEQRVAQHQKELDERAGEHRKEVDTVIERVLNLLVERFDITPKRGK